MSELLTIFTEEQLGQIGRGAREIVINIQSRSNDNVDELIEIINESMRVQLASIAR